jgi:hypothetical protein
MPLDRASKRVTGEKKEKREDEERNDCKILDIDGNLLLLFCIRI